MKTQSEKISVASDPCADQELLRNLADEKSQPIRRALAANPNTPEEVLQRLWIEHPDLVLENPILALWDFSHPRSIAEKGRAQGLDGTLQFSPPRGAPAPNGFFRDPRSWLT
jgi:hypothetical protein